VALLGHLSYGSSKAALDNITRVSAAPIAFLLSDDASMITGVALPIDGGYTVR
jgi:enoyl-[acyl-carrier-protein] reductase (NADH)